ncbi:flagellar export chaperone FliS [Tepidicella baoligensis]|uniref:flagellar export chaperone FliS n=1 Tax=Tepidicella baoligensis TaxID=2707016 RepID=UPI0015DA874F|nr:flagellar export chaperone FliS [Tepidicella baoligensis]
MKRNQFQGMSAYRDVDINTRNASKDQHELVGMMYDGVLESIVRAKGAILGGDVDTKVAEIVRAVRILQEGLRTSLDLDNGGELAANLANLYDYCVLRLTQANATASVEALDEVVALLKPVAEAWRQMRSGPQGPESAPSKATLAEAAAPRQLPPGARRMSSLYGQGMALTGV